MKELKITKELARAAKYYLIMEEASDFREAHRKEGI